jgi:hypothetical protein
MDLAKSAAALPGVTRGVACAGTALESLTFSVNNKSFLFVSKKDARLKLGESAAQARSMGFDVGANGWVKITLTDLPAASVVKKWLSESHGLMTAGASRQRVKPPRGRSASR